MRTIIIGHRGVGKTQLLKRLHRYTGITRELCFDLDLEIEKQTRKSVRAIFENEGEPAFRELEKQVFQELCAENPECTIAVGSGFPVGYISENDKVIWLRRSTDEAGRIFLDRPRLEKDMAPLEEYDKRVRSRDLHFKNVYDHIYKLPEGLTELDTLEEDILVRKKRVIAGTMTILPELFVKPKRWHSFIENYSQRGLDFFEIRDDLLNHDQVQTCLGSLFSEKFIYSFRRQPDDQYPQTHQVHYFDWALELGPIPEPVRFLKQRLIISLHDLKEGEPLEGAIQRLQEEASKSVHLKFAPIVETFDELMAGYLWQQSDPQNHSFLPRSKNGRWKWFRLWMKGRQLLNFWCESEGSALDQPSLYEWQSVHFIKTHFAAVLGSPVSHSWTPIEQKAFFEERNMPVFAIDVQKEEWREAIKILPVLGLRFAAITSPLKEEAYYTATTKTDEAETLRSVNTLSYDVALRQWRGHNTDLAGFRSLVEDITAAQVVALWGGGGTLVMMKKVLPHALSFSASRGQVREEDKTRWSENFRPDIVVWAAPRNQELQWPSEQWRPKVVIDLNYSENSAGREYALKVGAEYRSGAKMFRIQAQHQRDYWE
jgi:shikimate 5-dehydrogenase/shikimate kinase